MNNNLLKSIREYLEACFKYHHAEAETKHDLKHDFPYYELTDIENGDSTWSSGLCRQSSFFVKSILKQTLNENWSIAGGFLVKKDMDGRDYVKKQLYKDIEAREEPLSLFEGNVLVTNKFEVYGAHWWLERKGIILDLSADQFGHESIILTTADDQRYKKEKSMSNMNAIKPIRKEALIWTKNGFSSQPENKETRNVTKAFDKLTKSLELNSEANFSM
jgi:hypothetical protein